MDVLKRLEQSGIVPVVVLDDAKDAVPTAKALLAGDMNAVLGGTVLVGACFVALNLLSDVLYRVLDPRAS